MSASTAPENLLPFLLKKPREHAPRPRNREIFDAVRVQGMTERDAALKFSLSKTRIHQICEAVSGWVARTGGGPTRTWSERQRLSEFLHRERLDDLYRFARGAWVQSEQVRTTRIYVEDGKPDRKVLAAKVSPGESPYLKLALATEKARARFEDDRPKPPSADEMTIHERLREMEELIQEVLRQKAELEQAQSEETTSDEPAAVGQVCNLSAAEEAPTTTPPQPTAESQSPPQEVAAPEVGAADRLQTCPTAPEPPCTTPGPGPVPPGEKLHIAYPRYDGCGRLRLTHMSSPEMLDTFWEIDGNGKRRWKPPIIVNGPPDMPDYRGFVPGPPDWVSINHRRRNLRARLERERAEKDSGAVGQVCNLSAANEAPQP